MPKATNLDGLQLPCPLHGRVKPPLRAVNATTQAAFSGYRIRFIKSDVAVADAILTVRSQLGSVCECGRWTRSWIGLTPKVHGCDKTGFHSEYVENFAVR